MKSTIWTYIALALFVACGIKCRGQFLLDPYRFASAPSFTPADLPSLTYWWVYTDIPTNDVIVTNWPARVGASTFEQASAALRPTNTTTGVYFNAGTRLTNNPLATVNLTVGTKASLWLVLAPETSAAGVGSVVSDQTGDHPAIYTETDNQWSTAFWANGGGAGNLGAYLSGTNYDIAITFTNLGINVVYTNNAVLRANASGGPYNENQRFIGGDPFGSNFRGRIREFAIFNDVLTASDVSDLHSYATNLYGYSP